jgi:hypothetical protein
MRSIADEDYSSRLAAPCVEERKISKIPLETALDLLQHSHEKVIPIGEVSNHLLEVAWFVPSPLYGNIGMNHYEVKFGVVLDGIGHKMSARSDPTVGDRLLDEMAKIGV